MTVKQVATALAMDTRNAFKLVKRSGVPIRAVNISPARIRYEIDSHYLPALKHIRVNHRSLSRGK
jgi:hypothetical protein